MVFPGGRLGFPWRRAWIPLATSLEDQPSAGPRCQVQSLHGIKVTRRGLITLESCKLIVPVIA